MAESEASLDEQLELKKRARRRLVGAAALALLAAIVLPMVMDHEPRPANQDIQIRIPSQDAASGIVTHVLPGKLAPTPLPPVVEAPPAAEPKVEVEPEAKPQVKADAKPELKPESKPEPKAESVAPKAAAVPTPAAAPAKAAAAKPADKSAEQKAEEARAASALAGGDAAAQWVVQLGAYKEAGNVKLLLAKLKGIGLPAYTEKFDSPQGPRMRVRAGPFPSKEAAEKAKVRVKIIGVDGPVAPK